MAKRTRPFIVTGVALASAAAIVTATPEILPTNGVALAASSTSTASKISYAKYELTAISDISISGINDAYWFGWGGYIGACCTTDGEPFDPSVIYPANEDGSAPYVSNPYYPGVNGPVAVYNTDGTLAGYKYNQGGNYVSGASGVLYYLTDNVLESIAPQFDLDNYFFEIGFPALPYVAAGEIFGTGSPIFQAAQSVFYYGIPNVINSIVVSAATLVPAFNIGPVPLGKGILASLYFYGQTPSGDAYGSGGLSSILAYISTKIADATVPPPPSMAGAAAAIETAVKDVEGAVKSAVSGTASSAAAKKATSKAAAEEVKDESTTPAEGTPSTEGSSTETSTEGSSTETSTSTETTTKATGTASSAKPAPTAPKTTKPVKPQNPLNKIGKQISDALGITKKPKSTTKSTPDSSSSSSSSSDSGSSSGGSDK